MIKKILTLDNVPVINRKIGKIDTIEKLKASTIYSLGDVVEVLGYYTAGDGAHHKRKIEANDDGSGVQLANGLWANIVHSGEVNVSWFGAKGDGVTDDTVAIQGALDVAVKIFFENKTYKIKKIKIKGNTEIEGIQTTTLLVTSDENNIYSDENYIKIKKIKILDKTDNRKNFTVVMMGHSVDLEFLDYSNESRLKSLQDNYGFELGRFYDGKYQFLIKFSNSRVSKGKIKLKATDSIIDKNEIWSNELDYAIQLCCSSCFLTNNQIVPGQECGVKVKDENLNYDIEMLRISSNYFDGSYRDVFTGFGIDSSYGSKILNSRIVNNDFWHLNKGGIKGQMNATIIECNNFIKNDSDDTGESDIEITGGFENIISSNTFDRNRPVKTDSSNYLNKRPPVVITGGNTLNLQVAFISQNKVYYTGSYSPSTYSDVVKIGDGNTSLFGKFEGDDISVVKTKLKVELETTVDDSLDFNNYKDNARKYVRDIKTCQNAPIYSTSLKTGETFLEVFKVSSTYAFQKLYLAQNVTFHRFFLDGVWGEWLSSN